MRVLSVITGLVLAAGAVTAAPAPMAPPQPPPAAAQPAAPGGCGMMGPCMMGGGMMGGGMMGGGMMGPGMMGGGMMGQGAMGPGMGRGMMGGTPMSPVAILLAHSAALNLTADQISRLQALNVNTEKDLIRRAADLRIAHIDLMQLLSAPTLDRGKVDAAIRDIGRQTTDIRLAQVHSFMDAENVLTADQRDKIHQFLASLGNSPMAMASMMPMLAGVSGPRARGRVAGYRGRGPAGPRRYHRRMR